MLSVPVQVGTTVLTFWDQDSGVVPRTSSSRWMYRRHDRPDGPWILQPATPITPVMLTASTCPTCSRPMLHTAVMPTDAPLPPHPRAFCPYPSRAAPTTREAYARCYTIPPGLQQSCPAVDDSALPWGHPCVPTDAQPTTGLPRIMSALAPTSFSPVGQDLRPLRLFGANVGGFESQLEIVRPWLLALSPDIVTLQEAWNPDHIPDALPPHMTYKAGHVSGQGTGLAIAWAPTLCPAGTDPAPLLDSRENFALLLPTRAYGDVLVNSAHLPPKLPDRARHGFMRAWATLRTTTKPRYALIQVDMNMLRDSGTPLEQALRPSGALASFTPLLPANCATNYTTTLGVPAATAIDHILMYGSWSSSTYALLPLWHSHLALFAEVTPTDAKPDPFAWKRYRWRSTDSQQIRSLATVVNVTWGYLNHTPASPDQYLDMFHHYARQYIPATARAPCSTSRTCPRPPTTDPSCTASLRPSGHSELRTRPCPKLKPSDVSPSTL